jgi:hypothetical protein
MGRCGVVAAVIAALGGASLAAQTVDSIVVVNEDIFTKDDEIYFLARLANALHVRTRANVIRRTLLLGQGDPFDSARVVESERALRNLDVFRQVVIDTVWVRNRLHLLVVTADGWSTKPEFNFSTAAGDETWNVGIVEQNFLGTATEVAVGYRHTPDRNALELIYRKPHFLARRVLLVGRYADLSDGNRGAWQLGIPFAQTSARGALETYGEAGRHRVLTFRSGLLADSVDRRMLRFNLRGGLALHATTRDYTRAWAVAQWRREDFTPAGAPVVPRSTFGALGTGIEIGHVRFRIVEHFNSYARREDLDLSQVVRLGVWAAPRAWGYPGDRAGVGPEARLQASGVWRGGFAVVRASGNGVFAAGGLDSGRVRASMTIGTQNLPAQTVILHAEAAAAHNPGPGGEFDFWVDRDGPRLFGAHAFTGTRMYWFTLEDRILLARELNGLIGIGVAPFLDVGGAWYTDQAPRVAGNVGLSLRFGPTRSVQGDPAEIAFGIRFGDGVSGGRWALTIRRGVRF